MCKKKVIKTKIVSNKKIVKDHYKIALESKYLSENSLAGQFVAVKVQDKTYDPLLRIPLGVHRIRKNRIELLYKLVGTATTILSRKKTGEELDVLGPLGNGFTVSAECEKAIIVAGGHGIAPLYALAEQIIAKRKNVNFFIGACKKEHILCSEELRNLGAKVNIATEDGSLGYRGYVTEPVEEYLKKLSTADQRRSTIFACGPRAMASALAKIAKRHKIGMQISLDEYMACGIGACLGCAVKTKKGYKLVCKDGPVFDAGEIAWE